MKPRGRSIYSFLVLTLFFVCVHSTAFADDTDHICDMAGDKIWYVAIGKDVFAFPYDQFFDSTGGPLVENVDHTLALVPPNPKAPLGCKDNPQQVTRFAVLDSPDIEPKNYSGPLPRSIYKLEMYGYPNVSYSGPTFDPVIAALEDSVTACKREPILKRWDDGTLLCTNTNGELNPLLNSGPYPVGVAWEFIISGNLYRTPLGQNLVEDEFSNAVDVTYLLTANIFIHYEWWPPKSAVIIDPEYLITVDKMIVAKLSSYRVLNYGWR